MSYYGSLGRISEQLTRITDGIDSPWVALSAIGTLLAVVVAVIGIEEVRSFVFRPVIRRKAPELVRTEHRREGKETLIYHRLIVTNIKWWRGKLARDVRVLLTYDKNGQPPPDGFIPIPLRWTYWNSFTRDISRGEPAYLDVFEEKNNEKGGKDYYFCWADNVAGSGSKEGILEKFDSNLGNPRLEFYERNGGRIGDITLDAKRLTRDTDPHASNSLQI